MLEKNYKLAEMIFLEQVMGEEGLDGRGDESKTRGKLGRKEHWAAGLPKVWAELLEMLIPVVSSPNFLLCISPYSFSFVHKKSISVLQSLSL